MRCVNFLLNCGARSGAVPSPVIDLNTWNTLFLRETLAIVLPKKRSLKGASLLRFNVTSSRKFDAPKTALGRVASNMGCTQGARMLCDSALVNTAERLKVLRF